MMKYVSTRGGGAPRRFTEILLEGLAPDGGLYTPLEYPRLSTEELATLRGMSYADLAFEIIKRFADDIPQADLKALIDKTYTADVFGSEEITPVLPLGASGLALLRVSNGPTLAFKDIAMQFLGNLFEYTLAKTGRTLNILGATSGDTGSSAEYAMRGKAGINVFMLSPKGKMSPFQTAQMFSLQDANIHNIAIEGVFDDCQDIVKTVGENAAFKAKYNIGTVNSINWARITAQIVYYFKGYFAATKNNAERVSVTVPSGNFGNILAGHVARRMGLPLDTLVLATNENNVLDEFFRTGVYRPRTSGETHQTTSPSMDISKASNFERYVFDICGRDAARVKAMFDGLKTQGQFELKAEIAQAIAAEPIVSGASNHDTRIVTIRAAAEDFGVVIDPHTADGVAVAKALTKPGIPMLCQETALPAKFENTILEAIARPAARPKGYEGIESKPQRFSVLPAEASRVMAFIESALAPQIPSRS
jgi:threonine synthase